MNFPQAEGLKRTPLKERARARIDAFNQATAEQPAERRIERQLMINNVPERAVDPIPNAPASPLTEPNMSLLAEALEYSTDEEVIAYFRRRKRPQRAGKPLWQRYTNANR